MRIFYLSFLGDEWLGAAFVRASAPVEAIQVAHALGINPGGEVLAGEVPSDALPPASFVERLLTLDDLEELDRLMQLGGIVAVDADDLEGLGRS